MDKTPPQYPIQLHFSPVSEQEFENAKQAIQKEYRDANSWKCLYCSNVELFKELPDKRDVYILQIKHTIEFAWTWEGATAFQSPRHSVTGHDVEECRAVAWWSGSILNVDEENNRIFVDINKNWKKPRKGTFYVSPFDFLEVIKKGYETPVLKQLLMERLKAVENGSVF